MVVYDEDFDYDEASKAAIASNKQVMVIDRVLQSWRKRDSVEQRAVGHGIPSPAPALLREAARGRDGRRAAASRRSAGSARVPTARAVSSAPARSARSPIQAIYRAVGYFGSPLPGVPFDQRHGVIPNHEGQVLHHDSNERVSGRLRDRLDQARPRRADRPHQVRRDGDRSATSSTTRGRGGSPTDPSEAAIPALLASTRRRLDRPRGLAPPRRARDRPRRSRTAARGSRSCPRDEMVAISRSR